MFNQEDFRPGASQPSALVAVDLRAVLELIPDAALMVDSHGRVAHSNSPARALFARGAHGSARWRAWHADGRPMAAHELPTARAARGERLRGYECEVEDPDGARRRLLIDCLPLCAPDGSPSGGLSVFREIAGPEPVDDDLRAREQRARAQARAAEEWAAFLADAGVVLASSPDCDAVLSSLARLAVPRLADCCAVDVLEDDGTIRRLEVANVDPAAAARAREMAGRYPPDPAAPHGAAHAIRTGRCVVYPEVTDDMLVAVARDEAHLAGLRDAEIVSALCVPLIARGRVLGAMSFASTRAGCVYGEADVPLAEDLARLAALALDNAGLARRLHESDRNKDEFLSMLAHELRNPLAPILNAVYLLDRVDPRDPRAGHLRPIISRQVHHLERLVADLLDVARIRSGKIRLTLERTDLGEVARRCVQAIQASKSAEDHELGVALPPDSVFVNGDPVRLEQVLGNLLDNAIKYTPAGGSIRVSLAREPEEAVLRVRDTGVGIARDMLPRIFELFTQVETSLDRSQGGLGLGLAVVRNIIERHGGSVVAESPGLGQGSEFIVRLPLAATAVTVAEEPTGPTVLIVEDQADTREMLRLVLELEGYRVLAADDGLQAIELATARRPAIALIDIGLPGVDGYEVARRLRAGSDGKSIHLIALTGYGSDEDRRRSLESGFDVHLVKPIEPAELTRLLAGVDKG